MNEKIKCKKCDEEFICYNCHEVLTPEMIPQLRSQFTIEELWLIRTGIEILIDVSVKKMENIKTLRNKIYAEIDKDDNKHPESCDCPEHRII